MAKIPNPYKAAIKQYKAYAVEPAGDLATGLDAVVKAMDAQAWVSTTANHFYTDLNGHKKTLATAETTSLTTFQDAYDREPDEVEDTAWQAHWAKIRQMER